MRALNIPRRRRFPMRPIERGYTLGNWRIVHIRDDDELAENVRLFTVRLTQVDP